MEKLSGRLLDSLNAWMFSEGILILAIIIGVVLFNVFSKKFIEKIVRRAVVGGRGMSAGEEERREDTLIHVFHNTTMISVWIVAIMMIFSEMGVNIGPMIAAAGVAGLAFGFGGQYLIRDIISGLFIILENQYRVGDVVCFGEVCGLVERVNLRLTVIRDLDGTVHHIPNGEVKIASNLSKNFSRINMNIGVSYKSDMEKVENVVNEVGRILAEDEQWKEKIRKAPHFLRIHDFADSAIIVKIFGDTEPLEQWAVAGELRKRLKIAFDKEGIVIPFPQRVIHQEN